jgi:uncharacterized RDD family membrane protein YckC
MRLASFRPRFFAFLADYFILNVITRAGGFAGKTLAIILSQVPQAHAGAVPASTIPVETIGQVFGATFWLSVAVVLNYGVLQGIHGATAGKFLFGLRVVGRRGQQITIAQSFLRCAAYLVSYMPLFLGFFAFFWSRRRQMWHDAICGTYVIKRRAERRRAIAPMLFLPAPDQVSDGNSKKAA